MKASSKASLITPSNGSKITMMQHLFVYGTLAPNRDNHAIMTPINNGSWQPATIRGHLMPDGGWGSALGFPAVIPDEQGDMVAGWVFSSDDLANHWARLDEFEGEAYQRIEVTATLDSGEQIIAFVYALDDSQNF